MTAPTITNLALDKSSYQPGDKARLTFDAADADSKTVTVTITVKDSSGAEGTLTTPLTITDKLTTTVTDTDGRTWTKVSENGATQVWEATV